MLLAGGSGSGGGLKSAEVFDPAAASFSPAGNALQSAHVRPVLCLLPDGKVQVIGGISEKTIDIYDPASTFAPLPCNSFGAAIGVGGSNTAPRDFAGAPGALVRAALCYAVRGLGKLLPLSLLWILLWPAVVMAAAIHWCRLRPFMKQKSAVALYRRGRVNVVSFVLRRAQMILARLLFLWPEQLSRDRWHRCRYEPDGAFDAARLADRPTLLVTLHLGPMPILLEWFRAQGLPVAFVSYVRLSELTSYRQRLIRLRDERVGLDGIPLLIQPGRTRDMYDHLVTHKLLIVAVDVGDGRRVRMPRVDGIGLAMNTGALQLARMTDARVVPCLIRSGPFFCFTIRFGPELNDVDVSTPDGVAKAAEGLWRTFVPMICMAPDECEITLFRAFRDGETAATCNADA